MRIAVTGTPGTGKTTATERLKSPLPVVHLNDVVRAEDLVGGHDEDRDTAIVDTEALENWAETNTSEDIVLESHLTHHISADRVIVLRCHPETLESRLLDRGESADTAAENAESEALDLVLTEAVKQHGEDRVYEIETTDRTPEETATEIDAVIRGEREPSAGTVSYLEYL